MSINLTSVKDLNEYLRFSSQSSDPIQQGSGRIIQAIFNKYDLSKYIEIEKRHLGSAVSDEEISKIKGKIDDERKFLNLEFWIHNKARLAFLVGILNTSKKRILDIGSGAGHFLVIAKELGHFVHGLDIVHPLFDDLCTFFELPRTIHTIKAMTPLPKFENRFDIVTSFYISFDSDSYFNKGKDSGILAWQEQDWDYFLDDIFKNVLTENGILYLMPNTGGAVKNGLNLKDGSIQHYFKSRGAEFIMEEIGLLKIKNNR